MQCYTIIRIATNKRNCGVARHKCEQLQIYLKGKCRKNSKKIQNFQQKLQSAWIHRGTLQGVYVKCYLGAEKCRGVYVNCFLGRKKNVDG